MLKFYMYALWIIDLPKVLLFPSPNINLMPTARTSTTRTTCADFQLRIAIVEIKKTFRLTTTIKHEQEQHVRIIVKTKNRLQRKIKIRFVYMYVKNRR